MHWTTAEDFAQLIALIKRTKRKGAIEYSYNELAQKLGYRSPRGLAMVCKRQRAPSSSLVKSICDFLETSPREREFVFWLAEKSRLSLKGCPTQLLEEKIARFRKAGKIEVESRVDLAGVRIEIQPEAHEKLRKRMQDFMREIVSEFGEIKRDPPEKVDSEPSTSLDPDHHRNPEIPEDPP